MKIKIPLRSFASYVACFFGAHNWSDGPGFPCCECGQEDIVNYKEIYKEYSDLWEKDI